MSKKILQFIVIFLAILIIICFAFLIYGMYLKIGGNQNISDYKNHDYSLGLVDNEKIIGIGETGLDYHYNYSDRDIQKKSFIEHIKAALELNIPIIVHSRNADEETIKIISKVPKSLGVVHCFASNLDFANKLIDLGYYISFTVAILTGPGRWHYHF